MKTRYLLITTAVLAPAALSPAIAQDAPISSQEVTSPSSAAELDGADSSEIIVTAQRREERLQDVPVSVSVIGGDLLDRQGVRDLTEIGQRQPNLKISVGANGQAIHIRGTGSGFNPGFEQSVATFLDGIYRSRSQSLLTATFDVERIEVLRGPQTTFFGANAIAGALNIVSRRPSDEFGVSGSALYAPDDGEYNFEAAVTGPLSNTLSARVAARASGMTKGYITTVRPGLEDAPQRDTIQGRISLNWEPSDRFTLFTRFDAARTRDKGLNAFEVLNCPPQGVPPSGLCLRALNEFGDIDDEINYRTDAAQLGFFEADMYEGVVSGAVHFDAFDLIATTGYQDFAFYFLQDTITLPGLTAIGALGGIPAYYDESTRQFSQEVRIQSTGTGRLQYMVGGYYERQRLSNVTNAGLYQADLAAFFSGGLVPAGTPINQRSDFAQRTTTWSGFGSLTYDLTDQLSASASLRYSSVRKNRFGGLTQIGTGFVTRDGLPLRPTPETWVPFSPLIQQTFFQNLRTATLQSLADTTRTDSEWMPSVNVRYEFTPDINIYARYTRGFKAGGFGAQTPDSFDPETVDAYEVGFRGSFLNRRLFTSLTLFRSEYQNLQEASATAGPSGVPILSIGNAARSRSEGVEFSATFRPARGVNLFADVAYLDSRYISFPGAVCNPAQLLATPPGTPCVQDLSGAVRPYAADWSGNVGAEFSRDISSSLRFTVSPLVYFTSGFYSQQALGSPVYQPGYAKADLRVAIGASNRSWEFAIIAKNIFDETTATFRNYLPGGFSAYAVPDRPRSIAFQLSFDM